jgi:toxin FitB
MTGFLLDTNCISEVVRLEPDPHVMAWIETAEEGLLYLSVLTLGEIRKGLAALPQGKRRSRLETWLEVELQARFSGRILSIDGLLAATAIHHNLTIVSRNVGDFTNTQAPVVNPWEP